MKHQITRFRKFLSKLDSLHWCMGMGIIIVSIAGWFAACECEKARVQTQHAREQYFNLLTNIQYRPSAPDHLK